MFMVGHIFILLFQLMMKWQAYVAVLSEREGKSEPTLAPCDSYRCPAPALRLAALRPPTTMA